MAFGNCSSPQSTHVWNIAFTVCTFAGRVSQPRSLKTAQEVWVAISDIFVNRYSTTRLVRRWIIGPNDYVSEVFLHRSDSTACLGSLKYPRNPQRATEDGLVVKLELDRTVRRKSPTFAKPPRLRAVRHRIHPPEGE